MPIYNPRVFLSGEDRELLRLLGELLIACQKPPERGNWQAGSVPLSNAEAIELLGLLESFVSSKRFVEGAYLVERLFSDADLYDRGLRDIYLAWRRRVGRSRAVASIQWENLLGRLGLWTVGRGNPNVWYRASASPMELDYFMRMEDRLATAANLHPRVKALILEFVSARLAAIDEIRFGRAKLEPGQAKAPPIELLDQLKALKKDTVGVAPISTVKVAAVMTIVLDFSAMFTTRDWSVAGFMSVVAGSLPHAVVD